MSININITFTFMHISRLILASKSTSLSFTFFTWIFTNSITFFHRRFVYVHTFFHYKMMCSCQLATCLYDIQQTSCELRLHHNHVAPSVPISAEFTSTLGRYTRSRFKPPRLSWAAPQLYIGIILLWEIFILLNTHTHMGKSNSIFSRRSIICTVYCWEKCKKL